LSGVCDVFVIAGRKLTTCRPMAGQSLERIGK